MATSGESAEEPAILCRYVLLSLLGVTRRRSIWRTEDHEAFLRKQLTRNLTPGGFAVASKFDVSESVNGMDAMDDLIFRDKTDIVYDPRISSRRRRVE